ncbi:MAG TPA: CHAT domain-containing protein [Candidatus Angelobacter sp.]|nr:CHAT domain-containing protein [Candidatus Angelobacter sp.]
MALLEYYTTPGYTLLFLIKKDHPEPYVFALSSSVLKTVSEATLSQAIQRMLIDFHGLPHDWDKPENLAHYRRLLSLPPAVGNARKRTQGIRQDRLYDDRFDYRLSYLEQLSAALLPQPVRELIADCELLCIVPHGPLHSLSFAGLLWSENEYLIERFGLCYAPSASVLKHCLTKNPRRSQPAAFVESCLIVAMAAAEDLDPLELEEDGKDLAGLFQQYHPDSKLTQLVGPVATQTFKAASKKEVLVELPAHQLIHIACHGFFGLETDVPDPLNSGILVSDGQERGSVYSLSNFRVGTAERNTITAREIWNLRMQAELIVLRACSSGRTQVRPGDELIGLVRALLHAGSASLLASLWNVNKRSSRLLLSSFYRHWLNAAARLPKWKAFRLAQLELLRQKEYSHPYHWASFALIGDWQ